MGISSYPPAAATSRLVTKANTGGQVLLRGSVSTTSSEVYPTLTAWSQLTASTSAEYYITAITAQTPATGSNAVRDFPVYVDLGVGGSGSESSLGVYSLADSVSFDSTTGRLLCAHSLAVPLRISAGSRVCFRAARYVNNSSATYTVLVDLHCMPYASVDGN